jgi:predicted glycoside hydrolase/deacetylase ChbG (UPF0249 family)
MDRWDSNDSTRKRLIVKGEMGDKVVQDFGLSRGIMQKIQEVMEGGWITAGSLVENKMEIAQLAVFVMVGYAQPLCGEEIPKLDHWIA